jgi:carboxylesterase type B
VFASDLSTEEELVTYLQDYIYKNASPEELTTFVNTYDTAPTAIDGAYLEFDRLAEVLGDAFFTLKRREFLQDVAESVQTWSFLGSWTDFPILGAFHTSDLPHLFYGTGAASRAMQDRYIAFINSLDPNDGIDGLPMEYQTQWPQWRDSHKLLNFGGESTDIISDDFRQDSFEFIKSHADALLL